MAGGNKVSDLSKNDMANPVCEEFHAKAFLWKRVIDACSEDPDFLPELSYKDIHWFAPKLLHKCHKDLSGTTHNASNSTLWQESPSLWLVSAWP